MTTTSTPVTTAERAPATTRAATGGARARAPRRDIQVLRAVAVAAVVVFHLWPSALPGGYVGVDVFFVVSGFLITSHLLRTPPTSPRALGAFWARRVRRLLPAAGVVLAVTTIASVALLPSHLLRPAARELLASTLLVENWELAHQATDYLAAETTPTPVQHFWSLGVEEQFYLGWPLLLAVAILVGRRFGRTRLAAGVAIALVGAVSLAHSANLTHDDPARAYFVTPTRVWELALGALVAVVGVRTAGWARARALLAWSGAAAIVVACLAFDGATPFPGTAALLPTLGAALVVATATDDVPGGVGRVLGSRPVVALGDVSYGVYLWHWPLLVLAPFAVGAALGGWARVPLVVLTLLLAAATTRWVEAPVRRSARLRASLPRTFTLGALTAAVCVGLACGAGAVAADRAAGERAVFEAARTGEVPCFGAQAVRDPACPDPVGEALLMSPGVAATDRSELYQDGCWNNAPFTGRRTCTYGSDAPVRRVVLLGNSHAGQWQPALVDQVQREGWSLRTYLTSECYPVDLPIEVPVPAEAPGCAAWTRWAVDDALAQRPDLVVLAARTFRPLLDVPDDAQHARQQEAYSRLLARFTAAGVPVLVLRDTPNAGDPAPDCVAWQRDGWRECVQPQDVAVEPDPLADAAAADSSGRVSVLDLNRMICWDGTCHDVVGGAIVYFDHGHLTRTFARTLQPEVEAAVAERIRG
ncbi:acyltransferase [Cellulomonas sp. DKR-3]|uniref:Acyltransferase n=1 Tax=Cellulomonas fulva TaxID=2835530 RepID=A0ABS5U0P7_9CELL|nr:acyltransferase family protein [Cellulomonas fulva]MBT0994975.1 acyltransferase [Cellulomonas fulva]